jgi:hypothetical protein
MRNRVLTASAVRQIVREEITLTPEEADKDDRQYWERMRQLVREVIREELKTEPSPAVRSAFQQSV